MKRHLHSVRPHSPASMLQQPFFFVLGQSLHDFVLGMHVRCAKNEAHDIVSTNASDVQTKNQVSFRRAVNQNPCMNTRYSHGFRAGNDSLSDGSCLLLFVTSSSMTDCLFFVCLFSADIGPLLFASTIAAFCKWVFAFLFLSVWLKQKKNDYFCPFQKFLCICSVPSWTSDSTWENTIKSSEKEISSFRACPWCVDKLQALSNTWNIRCNLYKSELISADH